MKLRPMLVTSGPLSPNKDKSARSEVGRIPCLIEASPIGVTIWSRNGNDMSLDIRSSTPWPAPLQSHLLSTGRSSASSTTPRLRRLLVPKPCVDECAGLLHGLRRADGRRQRPNRGALSGSSPGPRGVRPQRVQLVHTRDPHRRWRAVLRHQEDTTRRCRRQASQFPVPRWDSLAVVDQTKHFRTRNFALLGWCLLRSGARIAVVSSSICDRSTGSRWRVSWSRATAVASSNDSQGSRVPTSGA